MEHKKICSWCEKIMSAGILPESHGICLPCRLKNFPAESEIIAKKGIDEELVYLILMRANIEIGKEK